MADPLQPGAGALRDPTLFAGVLGGMVGVPALAGIDFDKTIHILVTSPKSHAQPVALVAAVSDEQALHASLEGAPGVALRAFGGVAVIGSEDTIGSIGDYALTNLLKEPVAALPTLTLLVDPIFSTFGSEIQSARQAMTMMVPDAGEILDMEFGLFLDLAAQTDKLLVSFDTAENEASLGFSLVPRPGSLLSGFVAAQTPSDYALLGRLPASPSSFVAAGRVVLGSTRAAAVHLIDAFFTKGAKKSGLAELVTRFFDLATGEFAGVGAIGPKGFDLACLYGVADPAKLDDLMLQMIAEIKKLGGMTMMGVKYLYDIRPNALKYDGVAVHEETVTLDFSGLSKERRESEEASFKQLLGTGPQKAYFAGFDGNAGVTFGKNAAERFKALVDSAKRGKNKLQPPQPVQAAISASQARKESAVMFLAMAPVLEAAGVGTLKSNAGLMLGLGFAGGSAQLRITLPTELLRAMKSL